MNSSAQPNRNLIFLSLFLAYICAGICGILPGPSLPLLAEHTGVQLDIAGWIFTSSAIGFVIGVIITGALSSKISAKYLLMVGLGVMAVSSFIIPNTHVFALLFIIQFIMGMGFGCLDVTINIIATLSFEETLSETLNNIHSSFGIGALVGPLMLSISLQLLDNISPAYIAGSLIGIITIILLATQAIPTLVKTQQSPKAAAPIGAFTLFRHLLLWMIALEFFLYVGAEVGFSNWISTIVSQSAAVSLALAAPTATFFWLGLTIGRLVSGQVLKRKILSETFVLFLCIIGGGLTGLLAAIFPNQVFIIFGISLFVGFFFGPLFPILISIASRLFIHALSTISSVVLISSGLSGTVVPVVMGFLLPVFGANWVMVIPAAICLAIIIPFSIAIQHYDRVIVEVESPESAVQASKALDQSMR